MRTITFEEYLQEDHAQDYNGTDDNMPDAFQEYLENLNNETMLDYFELYIRSEYAEENTKKKYLDFVLSLTQ